MTEKRCSKCGEVKPVVCFCVRRRRGRVEREPRCKTCKSEYFKKWMLNNHKKNIGRSKQWRIDNPEKVAIYRQTRAIEKPEVVRMESNKSHHKSVINCSDFYIKTQLSKHGFKKDQITPELIKAQRVVLKLKRAVRKIEK